MQLNFPYNVPELHYITPLANVSSIFDVGILPHNEAAKINHADISMVDVQKIRATKKIPPNLTKAATTTHDLATSNFHARNSTEVETEITIHDCANFYINARNPMLYLRKDEHETLCVLRIKPEVLNLPGVIVTDRNATTNEARFFTVAEGLPRLDMAFIQGEYWSSKFVSFEENKTRGQIRCAEILIPNGKLHPSYIGGVYVSSLKADNAFKAIFGGNSPVPTTVSPKFFFQGYNFTPPVPPLANRIYPIVQDYPLVPVPIVPNNIVPAAIPKAPAKKRASELTQAAVDAFFKVKREKNSEANSTENSSEMPNQAASLSTQPPRNGIPANITIIEGDLLKSKLHTLVNTVNCEGVMGKGIALQFKKAYSLMFDDYKRRCDQHEVKLGEPYIFILPTGKLIMNFPTKQHWKNKSDIEGIRRGLAYLVSKAKEWNLTSLAIPPLGCGNGWLNWEDVKPIMFEYLGKLDIPVELYIYKDMETDSPAKLKTGPRGTFEMDRVPYTRVRANLFGLKQPEIH